MEMLSKSLAAVARIQQIFSRDRNHEFRALSLAGT